MNEKERIILVWVLAFGSLLVALLYSPLGSPDMYRKKVYFAEYQGVQFTDGIKNAPKKLKDEKQTSEEILPEYQEAPTSYQTIAYSSNTKLLASNGNYSISSKLPEIAFSSNSGIKIGGFGSAFTNLGGDNSEDKDYFNSPKISMAGFSLGSFRELFGSIFSKESSSNSSTELHGFFAISTDISSISDNNFITENKDLFKSDSSDPGDGPIGEPIPVGDGWIFLIGMAVLYVAWKNIVKKNRWHKMFYQKRIVDNSVT